MKMRRLSLAADRDRAMALFARGIRTPSIIASQDPSPDLARTIAAWADNYPSITRLGIPIVPEVPS